MSAILKIRGPGRVDGIVELPGDKSISHRVAMLASVAEGESVINHFATSADCHSTLECIERLGIRVERADESVRISGRGVRGFRPADDPVLLNAGNSGSTIRMLSGLLAGQHFRSQIDGDSSLNRRPMGRVIEPLRLMGAEIDARDGSLAPLQIRGGTLKPIEYSSPVASAQVKTCVLFAGLYTDGITTFKEPSLSRIHTELMFREFGIRVEAGESENHEIGSQVTIAGGQHLIPVDYTVPADPSSAAFFVAAASLLPDSRLLIKQVCLNPTRTGFIELMAELGAGIRRQKLRKLHGEAVGDLAITGSDLKVTDSPLVLRGGVIPNLIDELPVLAVVATQVRGRIEVRDARELRVKESDRIRTVVDGIRALGGEIQEYDDGFAVEGPQMLKGGVVDPHGDHRIAMAFAVAGLAAKGTTTILNADCAAVSFPEFHQTLKAVTEAGSVAYSAA